MSDYKVSKFKIGQKARNAFMVFDQDDSGSLDFSEFRDALHAMGMNLETQDAEKLFKQVDGNGNGCIDLEEFIRFLNPKQEQKNVENAFKVFDADGNGYLSGSELREAMVVMGMDIDNGKVAKLFKIIDYNMDEKIELKEFQSCIDG